MEHIVYGCQKCPFWFCNEPDGYHISVCLHPGNPPHDQGLSPLVSEYHAKLNPGYSPHYCPLRENDLIIKLGDYKKRQQEVKESLDKIIQESHDAVYGKNNDNEQTQ